MGETIRVEREAHLALVTLNRPRVLNARNRRMTAELNAAYEELDADPAVRVVVITGEGRAFSTGMDLTEAATAEGAAPVPDCERLARMRKVTVAAINGYALGGGLEVALACDVRLAAEGAVMGLVEAARGFLPGSGGVQRLVRAVGPSRAFLLLATARRVDAAEACRLGLVHEVAPPGQLLARARSLAAEVAACAPLAVAALKDCVYRGAEVGIEAGLRFDALANGFLHLTEDAREGLHAWAEKRPPVWRGS